MTAFATFATAPIGPGLVTLADGLALTTTVDSATPQRIARSTIAHSSGTHGVELSFVGDAALVAAIGIVQQGASLSRMVGLDAQGLGWRLDTGRIYSGNAQLASGLPVPAKGEIVGVRVRFGDGQIDFLRGGAVVHSRALPVAGEWFFAVSMGSAVAGELTAVLNAGQWRAAGPAALAGWRLPRPVLPVLRIADRDHLAPASAPVPHARYEGVIEAADLTVFSTMHAWPWGNAVPVAGGARVRVLDADGMLDGLQSQDVAGVPVSVRHVDDAPAARYVVQSIEVEDHVRKSLLLGGPHADLDGTLHQVVFPPTLPTVAWRPVPVVIGAVASVPAIPVNGDGTVCWVADARVYVDAVYDRGDPMEPGTWQMDPSGQQLLLASPPVGPVTVDCSSIGPGMQPATARQVLADIMSRIGKSAWSADDAAALDAQTGDAGFGLYSGGDMTARQAMVRILASLGAWWHEAADGVLRFVRLRDPALGTVDHEIDDADLHRAPLAVFDAAPDLSRRMAYRPHAYIHGAGELVSDLRDVPPARRVQLMSPWHGEVHSAAPLPTEYVRADAAAPFVSCFWAASDAQSEIQRIVGLYSVPRRRYSVALQWDSAQPIVPGQVVRMPASAGGARLLVVAVASNPLTGEHTLTLWG